ncbi:MAG TPA: ZIP family metal transporter [Longimicrobiales bacterium]|nr:ZIP family metal transporter [Longimicrobiales bacterium]
MLAFSGLAALAASLGAVPQAVGAPPSRTVIGWANALAGGMMLGVAYALLTQGLGDGPLAGGLGALLGTAFVRGTHAAAGTGELDLESLEPASPGGGYKAVLVDALHAADEGVAIGVAMAVSMPLGIAMAVTLALHNVPEAMVLTSALTRLGLRPRQSAALAVAVNVNQVLLAVLAFSLVALWPFLLPTIAGFAVGALVYRTLVELLPESYAQAGRTSIAVVTLLAMGVVLLLVGVTA